jgi:hypothetical protein
MRATKAGTLGVTRPTAGRSADRQPPRSTAGRSIDKQHATGRRGIPTAVSRRILRLLGVGWPKATIARECQVSRMTVYRLHWGVHYSQRRGPADYRCGCGGLIAVGTACLKCSLDRPAA